MADTTRAKITIGNNSVELEGSEDFVSKYLESFRNLLETTVEPKQTKNREKESQTTDSSNTSVTAGTDAEKKPRKKLRSIELEEFELSKSGDAPSLEEFLQQKAPGKTAGKVIATIAYYIQIIKKAPHFTEGNIDFAYKALALPERPTHLHQIIINNKNKSVWFEETEDGQAWRLTRTGEIFVDQKLPAKGG